MTGMNQMSLRLKDQIIAALKKVYDPEMPVNIYELGLIYAVDVDAEGRVAIRMTLTAPKLPGGGNAARRLGASGARAWNDGREAGVTFDPPWTKDRMSEATKLALGLEDIIPIARIRR